MKDPGRETERTELRFRSCTSVVCFVAMCGKCFSGVDADPVPADHEDPADRPSGSAPSCVVWLDTKERRDAKVHWNQQQRVLK